jgi:hypothetical protein
MAMVAALAYEVSSDGDPVERYSNPVEWDYGKDASVKG